MTTKITKFVPTCGNCKLFAPDNNFGGHNDLVDFDESVEGECRRFSPSIGMMLEHKGDKCRGYGEWPKTIATDWCAEHKSNLE